MKKNKLLLALVMVVVLCLTLVACQHTHEFGDWTLTTDPTIDAEGVATRTCTTCEDGTETVTVAKLTDTSVWTANVVKAATHTEDGTTEYTSIYGKVTVTVAKLGDQHTFDKEVVASKYLASAATCTAAAIYYKSCVCGASGTETFSSGDPIAHTFDQKVVDDKYLASAATCTAAATYYKSCTCGAKGTETFSNGDPIAHTYDQEVVDSKYLASAATCTAAATYYKSCTCGAKGTVTFTSGTALDHDWAKDFTVDSPASCTAVGSKSIHCLREDCDATKEETSIPMTDHAYKFVSWDRTPTLDMGGAANVKCKDCDDEARYAYVQLSYSPWTKTVSKEATYEEDGIDDYTRDILGDQITVSVATPRLIAPFEGKSYYGVMLFNNHNTVARDNCLLTIGAKGIADDTFYKINSSDTEEDGEDESGNDYSTGTYSNQKIKFTLVDAATGAITVTFTWTETSSDTSVNKSEVYNGFVSADGKTIVFDRYAVGNTTKYQGEYIFVQVDDLSTTVTTHVSQQWGSTSKAIGFVVGDSAEHIVFKHGDNFHFGVKLSDLTGAALSVDNCENSDNIVVKTADGTRLAGFVKVEQDNGKYSVTETDGLDGVYTCDTQTVTLNGNGSITIASDSAVYSGTYTAIAGQSNKIGALISLGDTKEYWIITLDGNSCTKVKPLATVQFELNGGTLDDDTTSASVNVNVAYTLPTPTKKDAIFRGWYLTEEPDFELDEPVTSVTVTEEGTTLTVYAIFFDPITVTYKALADGTDSQAYTIGVGGLILSHAPDYVAYQTLNAAGDKVFVGWFIQDNQIADDQVFEDVDAGETLEIVAKWADRHTLTLVYGHAVANATLDVATGEQVVSALESKNGNRTYNNGRKFVSWVVDTNNNGVADAGEVALSADATISGDLTLVATWDESVSWRIDNGGKSGYGFSYDAENNQWISTNKGKGSTTAYFYIYAIGGDIEVSFKFWASSEAETKWDYASLYYFANAETTSYTTLTSGGKTNTVGNAHEISITLSPRDGDNAPLYITYQKDSSTDGGTDTAYIIDLVINGVSITTAQSPDFKDGTYTSDGKDDLVLDGFGSGTLGSEIITYTLADSTADYTLLAKTANKTYKVTLTGTTYTAVEYTATVSFDFGDLSASLDSVSVPFGTVYTLPAAPEIDGYTFRGWCDTADRNNIVTTVDVDSAAITLYAKYDVAVTVTYNYLDGTTANGTENLFANDKASAVPAVTTKFGTKVFAGWFTKDGTSDNDWGVEFVNGTAVTASITVYAKWIEPHALAGDWSGWKFDPNESKVALTNKTSSATPFTVDSFGNAARSTTWSTTEGIIKDYDATTGTFAFVVGSSRYNGHADVANGILFVDDSSNQTNAHHDIWIFARTNGNTVKSASSVSWGKGITKLVTFVFSDETEITAFVHDKTITAGATWTATANDGSALTTYSQLANDATVASVTVGETTVSFAKNVSNDFVAQDGTQGTFTCEGKQDIVLNGAGLVGGALVGTYTVAADDAGYTYDVTTEDGQYKLTVSGSTYTLADNRVTITFVNDLKTIDAITPFSGKQATLPAGDAVAVDGYKFRGWYDDDKFTGSASTTVTSTTNKTFYAKYDVAVTVTYNYLDGTTASGTENLFANDKASAVPTVTTKFGTKVFAGWFTKDGTSDNDWGVEFVNGSVVTDNVTVYGKWVEPHALMGVYKGFEFYTSYFYTNLVTVVIDALGNATWNGSSCGVATLNSETGVVKFSGNGRYVCYDAVGQTLRASYSSNATSFTTDTYVLTKVDNADVVVSNSTSNVVRWDSKYQQLGIFTVGGVDKYFYVTRTGVHGNVTVSVVSSTGEAVTGITNFAKAGNKMTITAANGQTIATFGYLDNDFVLFDGNDGTYTGDYGTIVVDGYGNVTVGDQTVAYTADGNNITFVANNAIRTVALGDGTYTKVADGYQGTYTLPDSTATITLDGFGGAGDGKTYVISGTTITIHDGDNATSYGIDKANKTFVAKSIFAGLIFSGTYYDEYDEWNTAFRIIFDDSPSLTGVLASGYNDSHKAKFTATFDGTTLILTITENIAAGGDFVGHDMTLTLSGNTLTVTDWYKTSGTYTFEGGKLTCPDYQG